MCTWRGKGGQIPKEKGARVKQDSQSGQGTEKKKQKKNTRIYNKEQGFKGAGSRIVSPIISGLALSPNSTCTCKFLLLQNMDHTLYVYLSMKLAEDLRDKAFLFKDSMFD